MRPVVTENRKETVIKLFKRQALACSVAAERTGWQEGALAICTDGLPCLFPVISYATAKSQKYRNVIKRNVQQIGKLASCPLHVPALAKRQGYTQAKSLRSAKPADLPFLDR